MSDQLPRTLKISSRPLWRFALVLSPLLVLAAISFAQAGAQTHVIFLAAVPFILLVIVATILLSQRITVGADGIETAILFRFRRQLPYSRIKHTKIQYAPGRAQPVLAHIHTTDREAPVVTISLKAVVAEDAAWFCALPQLKTTGAI